MLVCFFAYGTTSERYMRLCERIAKVKGYQYRYSKQPLSDESPFLGLNACQMAYSADLLVGG